MLSPSDSLLDQLFQGMKKKPQIVDDTMEKKMQCMELPMLCMPPGKGFLCAEWCWIGLQFELEIQPIRVL